MSQPEEKDHWLYSSVTVQRGGGEVGAVKWQGVGKGHGIRPSMEVLEKMRLEKSRAMEFKVWSMASPGRWLEMPSLGSTLGLPSDNLQFNRTPRDSMGIKVWKVVL